MRRLTILWILLFAAGARAQTADDLFNENILHEIHVDLRAADWAYLKDHFLDDTYFPCNFTWKFNGRDVAAPQIGCRNRGNGSRSAVKPGLRLQIDKYDKDRTFLGLKTIVLRNNTQDSSMMHERVSMAFMRRMGISAPRSVHARLFVNGQYAGLYTIVEEVDDVFTKRQYGDGNGYLFKLDYGQGDIGHIFEYLGADPKNYSPKPFKPESHEDNPQADVIEAMFRTINQASDANFEQAVSAFVDLKAFLLEIGVEGFLAEQDGILGDYGLNNFYIYRLPGSNRFNFIPWDKSNAFFNIDRPAYSNASYNILSRRTLAIPAMSARFVDVLLNAIASAGGPGGWLEQEITREYNQIHQAALDDPYKQCDPGATGNVRSCTNAEFENEAALMMRFARERGDIVSREMSQTLNAAPGRQPFSVADRGGASFVSTGIGPAVSGYARIQPTTGDAAPAALAILGFRQNNILVSETAVQAAPAIRNGRIYAEVAGPIKTGVAIVNPGSTSAQIAFYFTDVAGRSFGQGNLTILPGRQISAFLNEAPFNGGAQINGSFTFASSVPVGVTALRGFTNERSEFLLSTLPVADLDTTIGNATLMPDFVDGGGWATRLILINPFDDPLSGSVDYAAKDSTGTETRGSLPFTVAPRSSFALPLALQGTGTAVRSGYARIISTRVPSSFALLSYRANGVTVSEASALLAPAGTAFRMYVEKSGSLQTGIAVATTSTSPVVLNFDVTGLDGRPAGFSGTATVAAGGQTAMFLNQIQGLQNLPASFRGVLRISAASAVSVVGLRSRYNERGDFLISTTPPVLETTTPPSGDLIVPEIADSGGYTTQWILYGAYAGRASTGVIQVFSQDGSVLGLRYQP